MLICYLNEKETQIFSTRKKTISVYYKGDPQNLKKVNYFGKKYLVISGALTLHTYRKYPIGAIKDLEKIIKLELEELSPIPNPAFAYCILGKTSNEVNICVWFWESYLTNNLIGKFKPNYIIPEDALYFGKECEILIFYSDLGAYLVAFDKDGFIESSFVQKLDEKDYEIFVKSLGKKSLSLKKITVIATAVPDFLKNKSNVYIKKPPTYPLFIDNISASKLKTFKTKAQIDIEKIIFFGTRVVFWATCAYALSLYLTNKNYEKAIDSIKSKINSQTNLINKFENVHLNNYYSEVLNEQKELEEQSINPLKVMNAIALNLPKDSAINSFNLKEKNLELTVTSKTPLDVINDLSKIDFVKDIALSGIPVQNISDKTFSFYIKMTIK